MGSGALVGALAIFTIGAGLIAAIVYLSYFLRDPDNREHAHRTLVRDHKSASTEHEEGGAAPLKERLDRSAVSSHPDDPTPAARAS